MGKFRYTPDMLTFLEAGYKAMRIPALTRAFNEAFDQDKTAKQIKCCLSNKGFTCGRPTGGEKGKLRLFTQEEMEFAREHYGKMGRALVTTALNKAFGTQYTEGQVISLIKNHGLYSARTGHFTPGHVPFNKGMKGWQAGGRAKETQFKPGRPAHEARNYLPIGSTRLSKDGYLERKVTDDLNLVPARRWEFEHRLVWEAVNGPIPENHVVVFLDGDKLNCDLDNLRCVPRGALLYMNRTGLNDTAGETRKAAILTAELVTRAHKRARA